MNARWLACLRTQAQHAALRACLATSPEQLSQAGRALVAAAAGAALLLAWQAPSILEARAHGQARLQKLQEQIELLQTQLGQASAPAPAQPMPAQAPAVHWHWPQLAADSGLQVLHFKPLAQDSASIPGQVQLQLRGRYAQHGAWMAALAAEPLRLVSYQLRAGQAGLHLADAVIELPRPGSAALPATGPARRYLPAAQLDPLGEPQPSDPLASLPAPWRAEFARPRQWLEGAALSELALAGTLRREQEWLALVRRDHTVHSVRVGDYLGRDLGRIEHIDEQGLRLREIVRGDDASWRLRERRWRVGEAP